MSEANEPIKPDTDTDTEQAMQDNLDARSSNIDDLQDEIEDQQTKWTENDAVAFTMNEQEFNADNMVQALVDGGSISYDALLDLKDKHPELVDEIDAVIAKQEIPIKGMDRNGMASVNHDGNGIQADAKLTNIFSMVAAPTPSTAPTPKIEPTAPKIDITLQQNMNNGMV